MTPSERLLLRMISESGKPRTFSKEFSEKIPSFDQRALVYIIQKLIIHIEKCESNIQQMKSSLPVTPEIKPEC
jgi:hypothetical protein